MKYLMQLILGKNANKEEMHRENTNGLESHHGLQYSEDSIIRNVSTVTKATDLSSSNISSISPLYFELHSVVKSNVTQLDTTKSTAEEKRIAMAKKYVENKLKELEILSSRQTEAKKDGEKNSSFIETSKAQYGQNGTSVNSIKTKAMYILIPQNACKTLLNINKQDLFQKL